MHYTLHLTNNCNMACDYCYVENKKIETMTFTTARKAADLASLPDAATAVDLASLPYVDAADDLAVLPYAGTTAGADADSMVRSVGIIFFGGEPLLEKKLIFDTVNYCKLKEKDRRCFYHFKVTTNGLLLDAEFLNFSKNNGLLVAFSHDGVKKAHDRHRIKRGGEGTFDTLASRIDMLLEYQPYAPVLMTVNPDTVQYYADSVRYFFEKGFKYIICSMNYAGKWDEASLVTLKEQYLELAELYYEKTLHEDKFYLSPFEVKISSHINRGSYCKERCELGKKQISVAPDGTLYPCVQFVGDIKYSIGHVDKGIDEIKRSIIYDINEEDKPECGSCAVNDRCNNHCGCLNRQATGYINKVSPVLCAHERILLPIADSLAEKLYRKRSAMFVQKHYNDMYPLVSLIEDKATGNKGRRL